MTQQKAQRKDILQRLAPLLDDRDILVAALAGTTNECFHHLHRPGNLYLVGMGMVTPVSFGLARALPKRRIIALDTDGSLLLSPSILPVVAAYKPANLCIVVFDNEQLYGSRGGPASQTAHGSDLAGMAKGAGIGTAATIDNTDAFLTEFGKFASERGPAVIVCKIESTYGRGAGPNFNGQENKFRLVRLIEETEGIQILEGSKYVADDRR
ncbi:MAG TPA: thiamine pyrophosphate-dependent enzyme [Candidatus Udaeobacter sp.]|jgi:thiamine pyrophosphate-dependent acetolactate synthase large subunit-like protein|nr:thiamine pyrophosphate-dependent enzyme [Candidatus Udaeobacter sp.]